MTNLPSRAVLPVAVLLATFALLGCRSGSDKSGEPTAQTQQASTSGDHQHECEGEEQGENCDAGKHDAAPPPSDAGSSCGIVLDATRIYSPSQWIDGTASSQTPVVFQIPANVPVVVGNAGNKDATLSFKNGNGATVTCSYRGGSHKAHPDTPAEHALGLNYVFQSCSNNAAAGSNATATTWTLHIQNGDDKDPAGKTEARVSITPGGAQSCDDGNACTVDSCGAGGTCQHTAVVCAASDQCHDVGTCNPSTGACSNPAKANGASCSDGNACTQSDTCQAGTCTGSNPVACAASDQCHDVGSCNPSTGTCSNPVKADGASCSDGNACTQSDTCHAGVCTGSNPVTCTASDQCHAAGSCDPGTGACSNPAKSDGTSCNDGNACTLADTCHAGACTGTNPVTCAASDQCHAAGVCDPTSGACTNPAKPNGASCDDGNACTQTDSCQAGACAGSNPITCSASDQCHAAGSCNPSTGACTNPAKANGTACNDGNACTQSDTCQAGTCAGSNPVTCAASDQCHSAGTCDPTSGACSNPAKSDGVACNDGNACTRADTCQAGACTGANPVTCAASDQCHDVGACNPSTGACSNPVKANGSACSDGNACTQSDTCQAGTCAGSNPVTCAASDQCHVAGSCDPASGACSNPAKANGSACSDGNACTQSDTCQAGACTGANPVTCAASDQCHVAGACDPSSGACSNPTKSDGSACTDGNACTQTDTCQAGACTGANPVTCSASDQCHDVGACNPTSGACSNPAKANGTSCSDGNACTQTDSCQSGTCTGANPVTCTASDQCHVAGSCDPANGTCSNPNKSDGSACNDGDACTRSDTCQSGTCSGANPVTCTASDQCHVAGTCDHATGTCSNPPVADGTSCTGTNKCNQSYACTSGTCTGSNPVTCTASDQCHVAGTCDPTSGACSNPNKSDGSACNDGNACTQSDACTAGTCTGSNPVTCTASDQCHLAGACDPANGTCSNPNKSDGSACNDGNACTQSDACTAGACTGSNPVTCTASDQCHVAGACDPANGTCSNPNKSDGTACNDGDACTRSDTCNAGMCTGANPVACSASDQCHAPGTCDPASGTCSNPAIADGTSCTDGNACTQADTCQGGACISGASLTCTAPDACHVAGSCDPNSGTCSTSNAPDGTTCAGTNKCNQAYACQGGSCAGFNPVTCAPVDQCHVAGTCDPNTGSCSNPASPDGTQCDDGNRCTSADACNAGTCAGAQIAGCDPSPTTGDDPFEKRASIMGTVQTNGGSPIAGYAITIWDMPVSGAPRGDVAVTQAGDGSFRARLTAFPDTTTPQTPAKQVLLAIDAPGYIRIVRDVYLRTGDAIDLGALVVLARDPKVTIIGPAGGVATDSRGYVELDIPPGALTSDQPIQITPATTRAEMPAKLPDATLTTYGFVLEPDGLVLNTPATLKLTNWRNLPTTLALPTAYYDTVTGDWIDTGPAKWDGTRFTGSVDHFSFHDGNPAAFFEWLLGLTRGNSPNNGKDDCGGSALGLSTGRLSQTYALPSYRRHGRDYGVTLHYSSGLAGSRALGNGPTGFGAASARTQMAVSMSPTVAKAACVPASSVGGGDFASGTASGCTRVSSCSVGGGVLALSINSALQSRASTATLPSNGSAAEVGSWMDLPLTDTNNVATSGFITQSLSVSLGGAVACASTGTFGVPNPADRAEMQLEAGPVIGGDRRVLMHHRHNSPFGAGWAVAEVNRLFYEGWSDYAVLVDGMGQEEEFRPRPTLTTLNNFGSAGFTSGAMATDYTTGEHFVVRDGGTLSRIETDGSLTSIYSGLSFGGGVMSLAVGYAAGERQFLIALSNELLRVRPGPVVQSLKTRTASIAPSAHVAARAALAYYTEGDQNAPILYRFRLTDTLPAPEAISHDSSPGGAIALNPRVPLGLLRLGDPAGVAVAGDGTLYIADRLRNAIYRASPDGAGEVGASSDVRRSAGDGNGRWIPFVGDRIAAKRFPLNQPRYLSMALDGTMLVVNSYGAAVYDPRADYVEWIVLDGAAPDTELTFRLVRDGAGDGPLALGGRVFYLYKNLPGSVLLRFDETLLTSEREPTRRLDISHPPFYDLVDERAGITEVYEQSGRMTQRGLRTGEAILSVQYETNGRLASITDVDGNKTSFAYDSAGKIASITDGTGRVSSLTVDVAGDLRAITKPSGTETEQFSYDMHHMRTKMSPRGDVTSYEYASDGTLLTSRKPAGETTTLTKPALANAATYASNGLPVHTGSYTDMHGVSHDITINKWGDVEKDTYVADGVTYMKQQFYAPLLIASGEPQEQERSNTLLRVSQTLVNGVALDLYKEYDSLGRLARETRAVLARGAGPKNLYGYDANGFLRFSYVGGPNVPTNTQWIDRDSAGHPTRIYDGDANATLVGRQMTMQWSHGDGQPSQITKHGVTYSLVYDDAPGTQTHNLSSVADTLGRVTGYTYDAFGNTQIVSDTTTRQTMSYDVNNRLLEVADALSNRTTFGYQQMPCGCTEADQVTSIRTPDLPAGEQWTLGYGAEGRLASVTDPDGTKSESYEYEPTGEVSKVTDRNGHVTTTRHDQFGRITTMVDALGRSHGSSYPIPTGGAWSGPTVMSGGAGGALPTTDLSAALGVGDYQIGANFYQSMGYPAQVSFYRDATFDLSYFHEYDDAARLKRRRDRVGQTSSSSVLDAPGANFYDDQVAYNLATSAPVVSLYAQSTQGQNASFSQNVEFDDTFTAGFGGQTTEYTLGRDAGGRLSSVDSFYRYFNWSPLFHGPAQSYQYQPGSGRVSRVVDADGTHDYAYDARGLLLSITNGSETYSFGYDALGRNNSLTYPDLHTRAQVFDDKGRITSRCYTYPGSIVGRCYTAEYDAVGNPTKLTDPDGGTDVYEYDALDRLTKATRKTTGQPDVVETYAYNAMGALKTNAGVVMDDQRPRLVGGGTADSAVMNAVGSDAVTLDKGGRITAIGGVTFFYNQQGQVIGAQETKNGATYGEEYDYDSYKRRVARFRVEITGGVTTTKKKEFYQYEGADLVGVLHDDASVVESYQFDGIDHPLRMKRGTTIVYYELDLAGNVRGLRGTGGADLGGYRYTAFGQDTGAPAPSVDQPLRWKGRWFESFGPGFYENRARWWAPQLANFLSVDGLNFHDRKSTLFGWFGQNPLVYADPSGHGAALALPAPATWVLSQVGSLGGGAAANTNAFALSGVVANDVVPLASAVGIGGGLALATEIAVVGTAFDYQLWKASEEFVHLVAPPISYPPVAGPEHKKLTDGEIKKLERGGIDVHEVKQNNPGLDLFKDRCGNIFILPKNGKGPGDPTGLNINDF